MNLIKTNKDGWAKDLDSGAIVSIDNAQLEAYRKQKMLAQSTVEANRKLLEMEKNIQDTKNDLNYIKSFLQKILESR